MFRAFFRPLSEHFDSLSRSQLSQVLWVLEQLQWNRGGYFVEFGATDGVLLINSWLLEKHFGWQPSALSSRGMTMRQSTIIDATFIAAPSSTKNKTGERDPEMHQAKRKSSATRDESPHRGGQRLRPYPLGGNHPLCQCS